MTEIPEGVWIAGGAAILAVVAIYALLVLRSRRINL